MRVLHVIPSLSPSQGGPSFALPLIARSLAQRGLAVEVATTDDDGPGRHLPGLAGRCEEREWGKVRYFRKQVEPYKLSLPFARWLRGAVRNYDLLHIHALFSHTSITAARLAHSACVPYLVRPIGVLNRWGMQNRRRWIKALSFLFVEGPILERAAAIHYTSRQEQTEAEEVGVCGRAAIVPLGVETPVGGETSRFLDRFPAARGRRVVLYLSRLDTKKGLDLLLPAFAAVRAAHPEALLVIAGSGEAGFVAALRERSAALGLGDDALWAGHLAGADKASAFAAATLFVLPSYSENFGIALAEAMAAGLPVITTPGVALATDIVEHDAGLVVELAVEPLRAGLCRLLGDSLLCDHLGKRALQLVEERFSLEAMGRALSALYDSIAHEAEPAMSTPHSPP
jgi:glycosyltransferase involved in cell wall biosynthesis